MTSAPLRIAVVTLLALAGCARSETIPTLEPQLIDATFLTHRTPGTPELWGGVVADNLADGRHRVRMVESGEEALALRINLIRSARRSILIQTFIWTNDECGRLIMWELIKAAKQRGVRVRIIADQMFSEQDPRLLAPAFALAAQAGACLAGRDVAITRYSDRLPRGLVQVAARPPGRTRLRHPGVSPADRRPPRHARPRDAALPEADSGRARPEPERAVRAAEGFADTGRVSGRRHRIPQPMGRHRPLSLPPPEVSRHRWRGRVRGLLHPRPALRQPRHRGRPRHPRRRVRGHRGARHPEGPAPARQLRDRPAPRAARARPDGRDAPPALRSGPIDAWPLRYASSFERREGCEPVPPGHPDFHRNWHDVGSFPLLGGGSPKRVLARLFQAIGGGCFPVL